MYTLYRAWVHVCDLHQKVYYYFYMVHLDLVLYRKWQRYTVEIGQPKPSRLVEDMKRCLDFSVYVRCTPVAPAGRPMIR